MYCPMVTYIKAICVWLQISPSTASPYYGDSCACMYKYTWGMNSDFTTSLQNILCVLQARHRYNTSGSYLGKESQGEARRHAHLIFSTCLYKEYIYNA